VHSARKVAPKILSFRANEHRLILVKDTAWVTANANSILSRSCRNGRRRRRMPQPAPRSRPRRSAGGRRATRRGQARRECPGRSIRIRSQQQQFGRERASLTAWIVRYPDHGLPAPADLDLGSIEINYPIGSAMLNDEAGGTIRADVYGHSSPEGEMRLPLDALYLG
jgi:hypothetical protein